MNQRPSPVEWVVAPAPVPYEAAVAAMEARAGDIAAGRAGERVWLLEHPPLYTAGTSARDVAGESLAGLPLHRTGRGGQVTYHGPGQRVAYVMLNLQRRGPDLRAYVTALEAWIVASLARLGVAGERRCDRVGVWVARPGEGEGREDKVAALGVRVRRWVTFHGVSLNVAPDLARFAAIAPCGITDPRYGVTSLAALGRETAMARVDEALRGAFEEVFGPVRDTED